MEQSIKEKMFVYYLVMMAAAATKAQSSTLDDYGLNAFNELRENSPEKFCGYIMCQENEMPDQCPEGTVYLPGVAQYGCCGACVRFLQRGDEECTGSVDSSVGIGYIDNQESLRLSFTGSGSIADSFPPNTNTLNSSWCDYFLKCELGAGGKLACLDAGDSGDRGCRYIQKQYDLFLSDPEPDPIANPSSDKYIFYRDEYRWRPNCTLSNEFEVKQCKGPVDEERCVCVDPSGNRIYGSAFSFQTDLYETMNCACSKKVWERQQAGVSSVTLHCAQNGNYEPLQCEDGWCYCIDPITTKTYGPNLPEAAIKILPCYKEEEIGSQYLRRCESEYHAFSVLSDLLLSNSVEPPTTSLKCDPDGSYGATQYDAVGKRYSCYTKYLEFLWSPAGEGCECVRDAELYREHGITMTLDCSVSSGLYDNIQHRGETVYCTDQDGVRAGPRVYKDFELYLECASAYGCQDGVNLLCKTSCNDCPLEAYSKY